LCKCKDIFLAGTDTSSVAMQWTMAEIMNNPKILNKLRTEIDDVVGTKRLVKESDIPKNALPTSMCEGSAKTSSNSTVCS